MSQKKTDPKKTDPKKTAPKKKAPPKNQTVASARETVPMEDREKETKKKSTQSSAKKSQSAKNTTNTKSKETGHRADGGAKGGKQAASTPRSERMIHQALPYILFVATLFLSACYLFHESAGKVGVLGKAIYLLFTGLFGWPAFLIPLVLFNLAIFWRKYVDMKLIGTKLTLSFTTLLFISSMVQTFVVNRQSEVLYRISEFWANGQVLQGGGVLGGLFGNFCFQIIGFVGSLIVFIPSVAILVMFLVGVTPRYVWDRLCYLWKARAEERAEQREIRREREEERRAEEEERLAQQERERYARRLREQQEAERRRKEMEAEAALVGGSLYSGTDTARADHNTAPAPKKTEKQDGKKSSKHQNDFIDPAELRNSDTAHTDRTEGTLNFGSDVDYDEILRGNERVGKTKKINQNVTIRPADEAEDAGTRKKDPPAATAVEQTAREEAPQGVGKTRAGGMQDFARDVVSDPHGEKDNAVDPHGEKNNAAAPTGVTAHVEPVRRKKEPTESEKLINELHSDPDFVHVGGPLKAKNTPEQDMKNNPEHASTELGFDVNMTPVGGKRSAASVAKAPDNDQVLDAMKEVHDSKTAGESLADIESLADAPTDGKDNGKKKGPVMTDASGAPIEEDEEPLREYVFPPIDFLAMDNSPHDEDITEELRENAKRLMDTLTDFNVRIKEITYSRGPTITRYELKPDAGIRVRSIANLVDDIALSLATSGVRIEAPIPDKPAVGVEVPNRNRATVYLRDLIESEKFSSEKSRLTAALGMDVAGKPVYFDISKMPHLLIAGATGMGKSVCINSLIVSLLYKAKPDEVRLILIDPKKVEFNIYREIPLLYTPIVIDAKRAAATLACAVAEMERRFELIEKVGVRDIKAYNALTASDPEMEHLPHIVIIIDELAELMMVARDQVETSICRIAQKARAAGMHLIIGTQRPSVDVITGVLKANIPSRIACTVASQVDSRTIIDVAGAEKLIGRGDMLFAPVGAAKPQRVQGAFVSEGEVETIVDFVRTNNSKVRYNRAFIENIEAEAARAEASNRKDDEEDGGGEGSGDSQFESAVRVAIENNKVSTSLLQRKLSIGYGRAAKLIDQMEELGYVSEADGNKPRRILLSKEMFLELVANGTLEG
ncbi:MAG: DNA translocase FtsK 4TM domain-containing protein [Clostridia bacterium]|nr:DNA translocase FtsK 4TM domain-containing protein [Clostridia bacterium]